MASSFLAGPCNSRVESGEIRKLSVGGIKPLMRVDEMFLAESREAWEISTFSLSGHVN